MSYCAIHERIEPETDSSITCMECWHTYSSGDNLIDVFYVFYAKVKPAKEIISPDEVPFCPLCLHDF